jgi:hypothetical protein
MGEHGAMTAQGPPGEPGPPPARRRRGGAADLVRSLVIVLAIVGLVIAISPQPSGEAMRAADFDAAVQTARLSASYDVVVPGPLPDGWRTVAAQSERAGDGMVWRLGLRGPDDGFVTIEQSPDGQGPLAAEVATSAQPGEQVTLDGVSWQRFTDGPTRALLRVGPDSHVLVQADLPWAALEVVARGLHS